MLGCECFKYVTVVWSGFKDYNKYNLDITGHSAPTLVKTLLCPHCEPGDS